MGIGTNIFNHVDNEASSIVVDVNRTVFAELVGDDVDLQTCLEQIDEHALSPLPDFPIADDSTYGLVKHATSAESTNVANNTVAITPLTIQHWLDTSPKSSVNEFGLTKLITNEQIDSTDPSDANDISSKFAFTNDTLNYLFDTKFYASETTTGAVRLASETQAKSVGTLSKNVAMTPLRTYEMINVWGNSTASDASESIKGLIRLATQSEVNDITGSSVDLAISPRRFNDRTASTTRKAGFKLPNTAIANNRTSNDHAVTVGTLNLFKATTTREGVTKLANNLTTNDSNAALTAAQGKKLFDTKIGTDGGEVTGILQLENVTNLNNEKLLEDGYVTSKAVINAYPVGSIYFSIDYKNPTEVFGGTWETFGEGRVLVGAGTRHGRTFNVGDIGGEYTVKLTEATIPSHKHAGWGEKNGRGGLGLGFGVAYDLGRRFIGSGDSDGDNWLYYNSPVGGDEAHENMQPYIVVNMWKRTA